MDRKTRILLGLVAAFAAALAASGQLAGAQTAGATRTTVKHLWATVNICDTKRHPDSIGIRGHAPGRQRPGNVWMRFFVQYLKNGQWVPVTQGGSTDWRKAGPATYPEWQELGVTFPFVLKPGDHYRMRGLVRFQWRSHGDVFYSAQAITSAGHPDAADGDPPGYSAATCYLSRGTIAGRSISRHRPPASAAARSAVRRPRSTRTAAPAPAAPPPPGGASPATSAP